MFSIESGYNAWLPWSLTFRHLKWYMSSNFKVYRNMMDRKKQMITTTKNVIYDAFFLDAYIKCHYLFSKMGINDACIILAL